MDLAGDIAIGPYVSGDARNFVLSRTPPKTLIYNITTLDPLSAIGAYSTGSSTIAPFHYPRLSPPTFLPAYPSLAPLENVTCLQIFRDQDSRLCRGILLEYKNGAQRALGQCRYGIDPVESSLKPARICVLDVLYSPPQTSKRLQAIRVESTDSCEHCHADDGWTCFTMKGNLEFWVNEEQSSLAVIVDD